MPADFVEPEGKKSKWGETVENKDLGVSYREKVIELPKYRQEETGIKRIKRREVLTFPEDFFEPSKEIDKRYYPPNYKFSSEFDDVYKLLTDNIYLSPDTLAHILNLRIGAGNLAWNLTGAKRDYEDIKKFKNEGMYFQEINPLSSGHKKPQLFPAYGEEPYVCSYATPVFIFGRKNKNFMNYLKAVGVSPRIFKSSIAWERITYFHSFN